MFVCFDLHAFVQLLRSISDEDDRYACLHLFTSRTLSLASACPTIIASLCQLYDDIIVTAISKLGMDSVLLADLVMSQMVDQHSAAPGVCGPGALAVLSCVLLEVAPISVSV